MKERPILFSAPMVGALLEGRKTQTRRVVKKVLSVGAVDPNGYWGPLKSECIMDRDYLPTSLEAICHDCVSEMKGKLIGTDLCPYGEPGDRLWVRETHAIHSVDTGTVSVGYRERMPAGKTLAQTDGGLDVIHVERSEWEWAAAHLDGERWRPSIFMPRWASRITLEITEVRVQRLQEISEEDAKAEGLIPYRAGPFLAWKPFEGYDGGIPPVAAYSVLWESINGSGSWAANPWVWAVTFKAVQP